MKREITFFAKESYYQSVSSIYPTYRKTEHKAMVEIKEVAEKNAPVVISIIDARTSGITYLRKYKGSYYIEVGPYQDRKDNTLELYLNPSINCDLKRYDDAIHEVNRRAFNTILINNNIYVKSKEPYLKVYKEGENERAIMKVAYEGGQIGRGFGAKDEERAWEMLMRYAKSCKNKKPVVESYMKVIRPDLVDNKIARLRVRKMYSIEA